MKNATKRLLAAILAVGMLFTVSSAFAETEVDGIAEQTNTNEALRAEYAEEIALLNGLGILGATNVDMSANISRVEFLQLVMKLIEMNDLDTTDIEQVFVDIPADSEYYNTVMNAYRIGLVHGTPEAYFNPDVDIDAVAALKILVCALEYGDLAQAKGGYPMGYVSTARDLNLAKRTKTSGIITWKDAIIMVFNALNSGAAIETYSTDGKISIKIGDDTVLETVYEVEKRTGIVEETNLTFRMKGEAKETTTLQISGKLFDDVAVDEGTANDLLGKAVIYYVEVETGDIVCIVENAKKNKVTVVEDDDIANADLDSVKYWDANDKEASVKIGDATYYYNGQLSEDVTEEDMEPTDGKLTLIDNNGDKLIDVVIIESWYDVIVRSCSDVRLASMYEDGLDIDLKAVDMVFYKNNMEIGPAYVEAYDVVKVMLSKDGLTGLGMVSGWDLTATIEKIFTEDGKTYFTLDGEDYEVSPVYINAYTSGDIVAPVPVENNKYNFLLDDDNVIFGINKTSKTDFLYGYMITVAKSGGLSETYRVKIYGENGAFLKLNVSEKIKVNGERVDDFYETVCQGQGEFVPQLVMYKIDDSDNSVLKELRLAIDTTAGSATNTNYDVSNFSMDLNKDGGWLHTQNVFKNGTGGLYYVVNSGQVPLFRIPYDKEDENSYRYYNAYNNTANWGSGGTLNCKVYDLVPMNEEFPNIFRAGAAVVEDNRASTSSTTYSEVSYNTNNVQGAYMWMVKDVYTEVDGEGETYTVVDAWTYGGSVYSIKCFPDAENLDHNNLMGYGDVAMDEVRPGDLIRMHYDNANATTPIVDRFMIYARHDKLADFDYYDVITTNYSSSMPFIYGEVVWRDNYGWILYSEKDGEGAYKYLTSVSNVWEYSVSEKQIRRNGSNNYAAGDRVFVGGVTWTNPSGTHFVVRVVD